jgi:hypothetical protein
MHSHQSCHIFPANPPATCNPSSCWWDPESISASAGYFGMPFLIWVSKGKVVQVQLWCNNLSRRSVEGEGELYWLPQRDEVSKVAESGCLVWRKCACVHKCKYIADSRRERQINSSVIIKSPRTFPLLGRLTFLWKGLRKLQWLILFATIYWLPSAILSLFTFSTVT